MGSEPTGSAPCKKYCEAQAFYIEIRGLKKENETLRTERAALAQALEELVSLKDMKDLNGSSPNYRERKPLAWEAARQVLNTLEI